MHTRQASSAAFLVPASVAVCHGHPLGAAVYVSNWAVSTATHSVEDADFDRYHELDMIAIAAWGVYNSWLVARIARRRCAAPSLYVSLALALMAALSYASYQHVDYDSNVRVRRHVLMHLAGATGSVALVVASARCERR